MALRRYCRRGGARRRLARVLVLVQLGELLGFLREQLGIQRVVFPRIERGQVPRRRRELHAGLRGLRWNPGHVLQRGVGPRPQARHLGLGVERRHLAGDRNLGAGLVRSALGVAELPFDGGRGLRSGLTGVLYSLPELLFQNIRKGYNEYVPPGQRPPPG
jgi:hypothetical protein